MKDHLSSLEIVKLKSRSEDNIYSDKGIFFVCIPKSMKQDLIWFFLPESIDVDMPGGEKYTLGWQQSVKYISVFL